MSSNTLKELKQELENEFLDLVELVEILYRLLEREREEVKEKSIEKSLKRNLKGTGIFGPRSPLGGYQSNIFSTNVRGVSNYFEEHQEVLYLDRVFHKYPAIIWSSLFLHIYAVLEYALYNICQGLISQNKINLRLDDLSHRGLNLYKIYLTKVIELDLQLGNDESWEYLQTCNSLRNIIIHKNSYAKNEGQNLEILKNKGLKIDESGFVRLNKKFIKVSINIIETFVNKIFNSISLGS